ncbi:MotA/TolQ/ExbB proton channel family protein, partial [uncultured Duncaniella sp.]
RFVNSHLDRLTPDNLDDFVKSLPDNCNALVIPYIRKIVEAKGNRALTDRLLADFEIAVDKELSTPKTLGKLGPILGLMGTLIPMGPALAGLAQGDIASMAYNMQVAFATTVIGLVISAIGFIVLQMRQRWLFQDLTNLEYIAQL